MPSIIVSSRCEAGAVEIGGMRIELGEHAVDRAADQLLVVDRLDVVGLDQLVDREQPGRTAGDERPSTCASPAVVAGSRATAPTSSAARVSEAVCWAIVITGSFECRCQFIARARINAR